MLFNSHGFIFLFLPLVLLGFFWLGQFNHKFAAGWLAAASVFFYSYWNFAYVSLLILSIGFNFVFGLWIIKAGRAEKQGVKLRLLALAITTNLLLLAYFKYANFFINNINVISSQQVKLQNVILPLGISFYTFTQIAFLVDAYQGKVREYRFVNYLLFVTYFPHLIAGPILHHQEMMPQFEKSRTYKLTYENLSVGITIFVLGLFKKVVLADGLAAFVGSAFNVPIDSAGPGFIDAWGGALAYSFQIYFDFSGYSDMAIGISRMFGIQLPLNFFSPYKASSIIEFWRRWHMTLSRFLKSYLYIPLGGNRKGPFRRYLNLMVTMLLGGFWHGAGWTFIIWGGLHGFYLGINHLFTENKKKIAYPIFSGLIWEVGSRLLTFLCVTIGWVFFRSDGVHSAMKTLKSMFYLNGLGSNALELNLWVPWILSSFFIVWFLPSTQEFMANHKPALDFMPPVFKKGRPFLTWSPNNYWLGFIFLTFCICLAMLSGDSPFLYFQF
jgi:D-alanyl-lipoteichoic acid acyltransferase DltB (MBOAT superfamily)